jgi:H+/Cl- antiporter ClcA
VTHTAVGATVLGVGSSVTPKYIVDAGSGLLPQSKRPRDRTYWSVAFLSAFIGSYGHVALDTIAHWGLTPWYPLSTSNQLSERVSRRRLMAFCVLTGLIGAAWYVTVSCARARRKKRV